MRPGYGFIHRIATRWMDNDVYGHVNNVVYYSYFDTVINYYLIQEGGLDIHAGPQIGLCVESHCTYTAPLAFPGTVEAALRVDKLGTSSVRYGIGLFAEGAEAPAAEGWFVHVFVDRATRRPTPMTAELRAALARLERPGASCESTLTRDAPGPR
jgi:acyl-CoA thioester hydrolase